MRQRTRGRFVLRIFIGGGGVTAVSLFYAYAVRVNSTTAALTYLLFVICAATLWGLPEAMTVSVVSMFWLDYFFLPPVPALGIQDPQNLVAWCAFLITSWIVSELSARLKKRASEAVQRQSEIERMYALSCRLMQAGDAAILAQGIPKQIAEIFGCPGVAFFDVQSGRITHAGDTSGIPEAALIGAATSGPQMTPGGSPALIPVPLGSSAAGSLGFNESSISTPAMQSIASLVALAIDRARKQEGVALAEGARRHQELKSMLLDALAHEFQTPLTSIRAGIDAMLEESPRRDQREWLEIMNQESARLSAMMTEAIQMARIEAGHVDLDLHTHTVEGLVCSALEKELAGSQVEITLPQDLPPISADAGLIRLVIRQIAGNALKYSQPGTPVTVTARAVESAVVISVTDRGPGIPNDEQRRIFDKYYRGKQGRGHPTGMGMGLPIAQQVVEAHAGKLWVESRAGEGATFSFTLPFAHEEANV